MSPTLIPRPGLAPQAAGLLAISVVVVVAFGTILGACILLGKIAIGDWLVVPIGFGSLAILFKYKVTHPMLVAATASLDSSPSQSCNPPGFLSDEELNHRQFRRS